MNKETSEISKLTERIAKDPKSKLFVPLAEEYKKAGDIEMSIHVLTEGLKNNPGYVTARSFLGRLLIEKGDFAGAQKEFEEVVKAIPDNLMAQKKLADLYALQNRSADALNHYKIALSLNPKDQETAMLIAEAEAGRDIKQYLHLPQPKAPIVEEQPKKPEQPKAVAAPVPPKAEPKPPLKQAKPEPPSAVEREEPEEVLVVEPLDAPPPAGLESKLAAAGMDFLAEAASDQMVSETAPETRDESFSLDKPFTAELPGEPVQAADEPAAAADEPLQAADDPFSLGVTNPFDETGESREQQPEQPDKKEADDFTTDTLAELYIAQGFYEKAVDIYERMLVDKPNSQGLKDKLSKVRAMAAAGPSERSEPETEQAIPAEIIPAFPETPEAPSSEVDSFIPPAQDAGQPRLDDFELPATKTASLPDEAIMHPIRQTLPPKHFDVGFEPREYIPPDAVPRQATPVPETASSSPEEKRDKKSADPAAEQSSPVARKSPASRKETVDRLESWLKNIIKES